jgi:alpha-D-ribose 1-methylphosphonate 5-triphosphate synthase subunit PhnI
MAYVAVKGGEKAIKAAHAWLAEERRGNPSLPMITLEQIESQFGRAVDRVMVEGSCYDRPLAARAIRQAQGDILEAIFLVRAYRTTLPRFGVTEPVSTDIMRLDRRISAIYKDVPGGQLLGPTYDYTHRLIDFSEAAALTPAPEADPAPSSISAMWLLEQEGLIELPDAKADVGPDLTREPISFPAPRNTRLQALNRGDEGFLLSLGYSTQRGYGGNHPFVAELRVGTVEVLIAPPELGFAFSFADIVITECQMVNQFKGNLTTPPRFTRGYGFTFGHCERKALAMALVDRAMRSKEIGERTDSPAQDVEFVLSHCDNVEGMGFVEHLKLPHYVDFQGELETIRSLRTEIAAALAGRKTKDRLDDD